MFLKNDYIRLQYCSHPYLEVAVTERIAVIHFLKCTVSFSFVVPLSFAATHCHLLSLVVIRCQLIYDSSALRKFTIT